MTEEERTALVVEKKAYGEVVKQFTKHNCDARMEVSLDEFLCYIENKIREINDKLNSSDPYVSNNGDRARQVK